MCLLTWAFFTSAVLPEPAVSGGLCNLECLDDKERWVAFAEHIMTLRFVAMT